MELIPLDDIDSTSSYAQELLRRGRVAPFAIVARRQSAGRGRRGKSWTSPEGNLYLSVVLPPDADVDALPLTPLKAALVTALVLRDLVGIRVTLKWPNDLLFAGSKLGGLLCEGSLRGEQAGEVVVGLGLNLNVAPALSGDGASEDHADHTAVSLRDMTGQDYVPADFAARFVESFIRVWQATPLAVVVAGFEEFAIGCGQLWREHVQESLPAPLARSQSLSADGRLILQALAGGENISLSSVDHRYAWIYQGRHAERYPLYLADVGNSRIKLARYVAASDSEPSAQVSLATDELDVGLADFFSAAAAPVSGFPIFVSSVSPVAAAALRRLLERYGFMMHACGKRPVRLKGMRYPLTELGVDRLCCMEGFLAQLAPAQRRGEHLALVVSTGTATTIDALRLDGEHLGGFILPGLELSLRSLHENTGLLPLVELGSPQTPAYEAGRGTRGAMANGAAFMTAGAALALAQQLTQQLTQQLGASAGSLSLTSVQVSGGAAAYLLPVMKAVFADHSAFRNVPVEAAPGLLWAGARALVLGGTLL